MHVLSLMLGPALDAVWSFSVLAFGVMSWLFPQNARAGTELR